MSWWLTSTASTSRTSIRATTSTTPTFLAMMFSIPPVDTKIDPTIAKASTCSSCSMPTTSRTARPRPFGWSARAAPISSRRSLPGYMRALSGPLHGGANQEVVEMLQEMHEEVATSPFRGKGKGPQRPFRLMGFGHRVYKNFDPRATIIKKTALEVLDQLDVDDPLLDLAMELEQVALTDEYFVERKLYPTSTSTRGSSTGRLGSPSRCSPCSSPLGGCPAGSPVPRVGRRPAHEDRPPPPGVHRGRRARLRPAVWPLTTR